MNISDILGWYQSGVLDYNQAVALLTSAYQFEGANQAQSQSLAVEQINNMAGTVTTGPQVAQNIQLFIAENPTLAEQLGIVVGGQAPVVAAGQAPVVAQDDTTRVPPISATGPLPSVGTALGLDQFLQERSGSRTGRGEQFVNFLDTQPGFRGLSPSAQGLAGSQFSPFSAQYMAQLLTQALGGEPNQSFPSFRNYLGSGAQLGGQEGLRGLLPGLATAISTQTPGSTEEVVAQALTGNEQALSRNLITNFISQGLTPQLRSFVPDVLNRRFASFTGGGGTPALLPEFVNRGFTF